MAGGPIFPHSAYPVDGGRVFANVHVGNGGNSLHEEGLGLVASVTADATWRLRFQMPPSLPTGTCKLRCLGLANATSGVVHLNPKWNTVAVDEDPSAAGLNAEGTTVVTWVTANADAYNEAKITLDATAATASEEIVMDLVFETTTSAVAQTSTWHVSVIWE